MKRLLFSYLIVLCTLLDTNISFAKALNLYSEPKLDSKITGTVKTEGGITIIYTPKNSDWVKVANPSNGDVGWVKKNDLDFNYNMRVITSNDGLHHYNVYQFGINDNQSNLQQYEKEIRKYEQWQRMIQNHMSHFFDGMFYFPQTVFVPVIITPESNKPQKNTTTQSTTPAKPEKVIQ